MCSVYTSFKISCDSRTATLPTIICLQQQSLINSPLVSRRTSIKQWTKWSLGLVVVILYFCIKLPHVGRQKVYVTFDVPREKSGSLCSVQLWPRRLQIHWRLTRIHLDCGWKRTESYWCLSSWAWGGFLLPSNNHIYIPFKFLRIPAETTSEDELHQTYTKKRIGASILKCTRRQITWQDCCNINVWRGLRC